MVVSWFDQHEQKGSAPVSTWWEDAKLESNQNGALPYPAVTKQRHCAWHQVEQELAEDNA